MILIGRYDSGEHQIIETTHGVGILRRNIIGLYLEIVIVLIIDSTHVGGVVLDLEFALSVGLCILDVGEDGGGSGCILRVDRLHSHILDLSLHSIADVAVHRHELVGEAGVHSMETPARITLDSGDDDTTVLHAREGDVLDGVFILLSILLAELGEDALQILDVALEQRDHAVEDASDGGELGDGTFISADELDDEGVVDLQVDVIIDLAERAPLAGDVADLDVLRGHVDHLLEGILIMDVLVEGVCHGGGGAGDGLGTRSDDGLGNDNLHSYFSLVFRVFLFIECIKRCYYYLSITVQFFIGMEHRKFDNVGVAIYSYSHIMYA